LALQSVDWAFIVGFFLISLLIGLAVSKRAGKDSTEFFLSGRNMPWWLLGVSMVATTFSSDTPNLVTDIVRQKLGLVGLPSHRNADCFCVCETMEAFSGFN